MISSAKVQSIEPSQELARQALELEAQFSLNHYEGSSHGPEIIRTKGKLPVVISSPHAVSHPREGRLKLADTFTGALALQLSQRTGAPAIIHSRTSEEDPNFDENGTYKQLLTEIVIASRARFVIDLHGLGRSQPFQLVIGTAHGRSIDGQFAWRQSFADLLFNNGFNRVGIDIPEYYDAARPTTITSFIWRTTGVPALQLEIHKHFRDPSARPHNYAKLIDTLAEGIHFCSHGL
jgi:hypothetical protein